MTTIARLLPSFTLTGSSLVTLPVFSLRRWAGALSTAGVATAMAVLGASLAQGQTYSTPGNYTWTCPAGVTSVQVEAWGGGGGGGGVNQNYAEAGGGAGGSFVSYVASVTPGNVYQLTVGAGGTGGAGGTATATNGGQGGSSYFGNSTAGSPTGAVVLAVGGPGGLLNSTAGTGTTHWSGSNGGTATSSGDLPGSGAIVYPGTSGGNAGTGSNETSGAGGAGAGLTGSANGGAGGAALTSAGNGNAGTAPGGGGSGGLQKTGTSNGTGGAGGSGQLAIITPIFVSGTPTPVSTIPGTASTPTDFTVTGSNLTANISLTAPTGFELSTTVNSGYSSSLTLTESGGTVAATTVYVRLAAADTSGTYSGNVSLSSGTNAATEALPTCSVVTPFTQGNLAVEQLAANATSSTFSIIELNSSTASQAAPVNTYFIPATVSSNSLRQSNAGTTGRLSSSNDGTLLGFSGFVDPTGTSDETTILTRAAASLSNGYQYTVEPSYTGVSANQTRGATYNNGTWYIADKGGVYLNGGTSPASATNVRPIKSFGGTVYALTQNASTPPAVIVSVSANGTTLTSLPGLPADNSATDFYMLSSGVNGSAFDILYVLDGANITKYSLVGGMWVANGSLTALGVTGDGLCAQSTGNGAYLYLSTGATNTVVRVADTAGYNAAPSINTANNVTLFTGSAGFLKGVVFAPQATALPDLTIAASSTGTSTSFSYTLTVANSGAANATGVTANFTLPSGLTYVSATDNGGNGFTPSYSGGVVSFSGGTLNANSSDTITINVTGIGGSTYVVDAGTSPASGHGSAIINTSATTSSPIAESNSGNNGSAVSVSTTLGPPSINVTGTPSTLSTSFGIASTPTSFSVSATNLSTNIAVTAPTGFELSTSSGSGYAGSLTLTETGGTVPATTIYVRLAASTTSGSYSGNVALSSSGASPVNEAIPSSTVAPSANLSGIGLSAGSLTQAFAATTTNYTEYVSSGVTSLTLTPMADSGATVTVNGASASNPVGLSTGSNTITVSVTASGGSPTQAYTITVIRAGAFTPGNLVVSTYGNIAVAPVHYDGQTTLITLEEFSPTIATNSSPSMAVVLPSAVAGNNVGITGEYGSSSEGTIQPTADGLYLTIGGYSAVPALAYTATATAQSPCATVPRVAALIDVNSNCDTSSVFNDIYNTNNPRSVYSPDDINLYLSGQGAGTGDEGGLYYTQYGTNTTTGGAAPTGIFNGESTRTVQAYGGNLYYSADQNSSKGILTGIFEYTGLPSTSESTNTGTSITPANNGLTGNNLVNYSPDGFFFANATTLYVADTGDPKAGGTGDGGIQKWVYNGSQWILKYTLTTPNFVAPSLATTAAHGETGFESLAGKVVDGVAYLYAVSYTAGDADPNGLYGVTDTVSATTSAGQSCTEIASAPGIQASGTNPDYIYKGVSFAPGGSPVNSTAASEVTSTGATLNGSINPDGTDTQVYFQYGTTTAYGSTTATQDLGSGTSAVPFGIQIPSGLQPGTTYNYRLLTVANGLTSTYANQTFTTEASPDVTPTDTPTMPLWALILLGLAMLGVTSNALKNKRPDAA